MDNSLTLARHFARLVWLLIHESQSTDEQKVALRAVTFVSKDASVRLGNNEGRLAVNGLVMPQALTGVQELAGRLSAHRIEEIVIEQGAAAAELLALARSLAAPVEATDAAAGAKRFADIAAKTVRVRILEAAAAVPDATADAEPAQGNERLAALLARLSAAAIPADAAAVLEEIAFMAEQSSREGRTADVADLFAAVLDREAAASDADIRRAYLMTARRLTKPTLLRPIATLATSEPLRLAQVERILQRCGQDGVDAVVDQFSGSVSHVQRSAYRDVLFRLPAARESLVQMLSDSRWHIVRQAADFLGEMGTAEAERPLADLLRHQDERVRRAATRALARIDSTFTIDALARAVTDDAPAVRLEAIAALAARKGPRAAAALAKAIDDEGDSEVQYSLVAALGRVGTPEGVQKLASAAAAASGLFRAKKSNGLRVAAVMALGDTRTPAALTALQGLANDREKEVRDAVARVLALPVRGTAA